MPLRDARDEKSRKLRPWMVVVAAIFLFFVPLLGALSIPLVRPEISFGPLFITGFSSGGGRWQPGLNSSAGSNRTYVFRAGSMHWVVTVFPDWSSPGVYFPG
jgi:hypothetical protein